MSRRRRTAKAVTRYNLIVPVALKQAIDEEAERRGTSGPDLARQLLEDGLRKARDEALWKRVAELGPKLAARDRATVEWWDRWTAEWVLQGNAPATKAP